MACEYSAGNLSSSLEQPLQAELQPQGRLLTSHPAETLTVLRFLLLAKSGGLAPPRNLRSLLRCHWDGFSFPDTGWELLIKQLYLTQRLLAQPCLSSSSVSSRYGGRQWAGELWDQKFTLRFCLAAQVEI